MAGWSHGINDVQEVLRILDEMINPKSDLEEMDNFDLDLDGDLICIIF